MADKIVDLTKRVQLTATAKHPFEKPGAKIVVGELLAKKFIDKGYAKA